MSWTTGLVEIAYGWTWSVGCGRQSLWPLWRRRTALRLVQPGAVQKRRIRPEERKHDPTRDQWRRDEWCLRGGGGGRACSQLALKHAQAPEVAGKWHHSHERDCDVWITGFVITALDAYKLYASSPASTLRFSRLLRAGWGPQPTAD